jgi:hypothetical protein
MPLSVRHKSDRLAGQWEFPAVCAHGPMAFFDLAMSGSAAPAANQCRRYLATYGVGREMARSTYWLRICRELL